MTVAMPIVIYSKNPIRKLDDFKGVKIRYTGVQNRDLFASLGAVPLLIAPPESQDALAKGIIDAAMFPHEAALSLDLGSVAKHATEPGLSHRAVRVRDEPGEVQFAAADLKALIDKTTGPAAAEQFGKMWEAAEKHGRDEDDQAGRADAHAVRRRHRRDQATDGAADRGRPSPPSRRPASRDASSTQEYTK